MVCDQAELQKRIVRSLAIASRKPSRIPFSDKVMSTMTHILIARLGAMHTVRPVV
ncbi:hypothetical protein ACVMHW_004880 [Bradyrhizobium diazoefficiens]